MRPTPLFTVISLGLFALTGSLSACSQVRPNPLTEPEVRAVGALSLSNLGAPPPDPSNAVADDPDAAYLGHALFFDTRLSANNQVSCGTCHQPERDFTDGLAHARGIGPLDRKTMSVVGAAHNTWQFWDGRKDSLWSQALGPLETSNEHGLTRSEVAELVLRAYPRAITRRFSVRCRIWATPPAFRHARVRWATRRRARRGPG